MYISILQPSFSNDGKHQLPTEVGKSTSVKYLAPFYLDAQYLHIYMHLSPNHCNFKRFIDNRRTAIYVNTIRFQFLRVKYLHLKCRSKYVWKFQISGVIPCVQE